MSEAGAKLGDSDDRGHGGKAGAPAWVMTFADLMSLLMCFFVLLLSFSEIEQKKYKQVAGSMSKAFGVQRVIPSSEAPKGTSIIAQEFSPGKPTRTFNVLMQQETTNQYKANLDFSDSDGKGQDGDRPRVRDSDSPRAETINIEKDILQAAELLARALAGEIRSGMVEVVALPDRVAIRVREHGSFDSGKAVLNPGFHPVLERITTTLGTIEGRILVEGHTDNVPISTYQFPSNWELSAARAATIVHFMTGRAGANPERLEIRALGEMRPLVPNDSAANRARNRRVEISLLLPSDSADQVTFEFAELRPDVGRGASG